MPSIDSPQALIYELRRKRAQQLQQGLTDALGGGLAALGQVDDFQRRQAADKLAAGERAKKAEAEAFDRQMKEAAEERAAAAEKRTEATHRGALKAQDVTDELNRLRITREESEATSNRRAETEAKKAQLIEAAAASALATGEDPDEANSRVRDYLAEQGILGVGSSEVRAAFEKARAAKGDADLKRDLLRSQVTENQAQAARAARGGSGAPSEKERLDIEAKRLAVDKAKREPEEKRRAQVLEVDSFVTDIKDNINRLKAQIKDTGTYELFGPENANQERWITNIATQLAKLQDPGSVAREGEVDLAKRGLFTAWGNTNATALKTLEALEGEVEQRRKNAYHIRGLEAGGGASRQTAASAAAAMSDDDLERRLAELKKKRGGG